MIYDYDILMNILGILDLFLLRFVFEQFVNVDVFLVIVYFFYFFGGRV